MGTDNESTSLQGQPMRVVSHEEAQRAKRVALADNLGHLADIVLLAASEREQAVRKGRYYDTPLFRQLDDERSPPSQSETEALLEACSRVQHNLIGLSNMLRVQFPEIRRAIVFDEELLLTKEFLTEGCHTIPQLARVIKNDLYKIFTSQRGILHACWGSGFTSEQVESGDLAFPGRGLLRLARELERTGPFAGKHKPKGQEAELLHIAESIFDQTTDLLAYITEETTNPIQSSPPGIHDEGQDGLTPTAKLTKNITDLKTAAQMVISKDGNLVGLQEWQRDKLLQANTLVQAIRDGLEEVFPAQLQEYFPQIEDNPEQNQGTLIDLVAKLTLAIPPQAAKPAPHSHKELASNRGSARHSTEEKKPGIIM